MQSAFRSPDRRCWALGDRNVLFIRTLSELGLMVRLPSTHHTAWFDCHGTATHTKKKSYSGRLPLHSLERCSAYCSAISRLRSFNSSTFLYVQFVNCASCPSVALDSKSRCAAWPDSPETVLPLPESEL